MSFFNPSDYSVLASTEGCGGNDSFGIKFQVAGSFLPDDFKENDAIQNFAYKALNELKEIIWKEKVKSRSTFQEARSVIRQHLIDCFPKDTALYVKEIDNEYCSKYCCLHLPWFLVTTPKGVIKIGWRKSVINIDWRDSEIKAWGWKLFENEKVTTDSMLVHAHGYEKATEYLDKILNGPYPETSH